MIPPSSPPPRSYSSSSSSSLHGSASVIYDAVTTCPVIEEGGPSSNTNRNTTPPLLHHLGRRAQTIDCPVCREEMMTTVATSRIGGFAIIMSLLVLLMASPFFWIPLVIPMCRVTKHYCSKCHQQVCILNQTTVVQALYFVSFHSPYPQSSCLSSKVGETHPCG